MQSSSTTHCAHSHNQAAEYVFPGKSFSGAHLFFAALVCSNRADTARYSGHVEHVWRLGVLYWRKFHRVSCQEDDALNIMLALPSTVHFLDVAQLCAAILRTAS